MLAPHDGIDDKDIHLGKSYLLLIINDMLCRATGSRKRDGDRVSELLFEVMGLALAVLLGYATVQSIRLYLEI
jgi:hypothetical protein